MFDEFQLGVYKGRMTLVERPASLVESIVRPPDKVDPVSVLADS